MITLTVLGLVVLVFATLAGGVVLRAGRQLEGGQGIPVAEQGTVAARLDAGLQRARVAVEELVLPDVDATELQPSSAAIRDRAHTYTVLGAGLLGIGAVVLVGLLLLL